MIAPALQVGLSRKQIARLIGRVFIQKSAVNLLSTVGRRQGAPRLAIPLENVVHSMKCFCTKSLLAWGW